ncbi:MAG: CDP-diacylglycerol--serine O-phosphatidyltransferase [Chlorobi bacterium]|nr:CDP-diacylglycerol--serine O-phosphatidyltransferase [Chlorobiota bacterium]
MMRKHIPNTLTILNLAFGFTAILYLVTGHVNIAVFLVLIAAVFDFLDGFAARMLKAYSELGKQLDSLSDMVSFGVVPSLILFHEIMLATGGRFPASFPGIIFLFTPVLVVAGAGLRLARFNTGASGSRIFEGLPTPAMALFMISLPLVRETGYFHGYVSWLQHPSVLAVLALLFGWLMISRLPMFSLKFKNYHFRENVLTYIFLAVSLALLILFSFRALFLIVILYIFMALGAAIVSGKTS